MKSSTRTARRNLIAARQHLATTAGGTEETDAYLDANAAVVDAEKPLPAWKRLDIDAGIYDHQGGHR